MRIVRFSHAFGDWPVLRQTPGGRGGWGEWVFATAERDAAAHAPDAWVVYEGLPAREEAFVDPGRVVFVTGEPAIGRRYEPRFLAQFGLVLTSQQDLAGSNVVHTHTGLPWHVGVRRRSGQGGETLERDVGSLGYDELRAAVPAKTRDLSVVCTLKGHVEGHRRRIALVERLKEHFGERLDWFGRGVRPIEDKWDAVAPYRFHIALEKAAERDYWTEKLADAYLGCSFPIYWGCPNVGDYFDQGMLAVIDVDDAERTITTVEHLLAEGLTRDRRAAIGRARSLVLERYNLFPMLATVLADRPAGRRDRVRLRPEFEFRPRRSLLRRVAGRVRRAF